MNPGAFNISPAQLIAKTRDEISTLKRRHTAYTQSIDALNQADHELTAAGQASGFAAITHIVSAFCKISQAQRFPMEMEVAWMNEQLERMEKGLKQLESPVLHAGLVIGDARGQK